VYLRGSFFPATRKALKPETPAGVMPDMKAAAHDLQSSEHNLLSKARKLTTCDTLK
jgi:hypothetical protein